MEYTTVHGIVEVNIFAKEGWRVHSFQPGANGLIFLMEREVGR